MCTCVTEGKSRNMVENLSSVSQGHRVGLRGGSSVTMP